MGIERNAGGGNKTARFFECQKFVASHQVSLTKGAKHVEMVLDHMRKITTNDSHAHDDIADTMEMAIRLGLIDGALLPRSTEGNDILASFNQQVNRLSQLRQQQS